MYSVQYWYCTSWVIPPSVTLSAAVALCHIWYTECNHHNDDARSTNHLFFLEYPSNKSTSRNKLQKTKPGTGNQLNLKTIMSFTMGDFLHEAQQVLWKDREGCPGNTEGMWWESSEVSWVIWTSISLKQTWHPLNNCNLCKDVSLLVLSVTLINGNYGGKHWKHPFDFEDYKK